uniref:Uncharacterized protein n=1 Tax=Oryza glumipatula TaxID=40148 RepID=A0A0D9Z4Y6_9ORYZ
MLTSRKRPTQDPGGGGGIKYAGDEGRGEQWWARSSSIRGLRAAWYPNVDAARFAGMDAWFPRAEE